MVLMSLAMAGQPGQSSGGGIALFIPMLLIFVIFYFLMLRPQIKRQKEHDKMLGQLAKGDEVVTSGGIHGVIHRVNEKEATLLIKIADDVKIEVDRSAVGRIVKNDGAGN